MVLDLNDFRYFVEIVNKGSFSAAGRALELPISTLSYRIKQLEKGIGLTLLLRSSRNIAPTDAGSEFYIHAVAMLEQANNAETAMRSRRAEPLGIVRLSASVATTQFTLPSIVDSFLHKHPLVTLFTYASDNFVDIVAERFDLAIRAHSATLPNSSLIQLPLADVPWALFASPDFLKKHGVPDRPEDLTGKPGLIMQRLSTNHVWRLMRNDERNVEVMVPVTPRMTSTCMSNLKSAAEAGLGIVALPACICKEAVKVGRLARVLPDWIAEDSKMTVLLPNRKGMPAAVRSFIDHLATEFPKVVQCE